MSIYDREVLEVIYSALQHLKDKIPKLKKREDMQQKYSDSMFRDLDKLETQINELLQSVRPESEKDPPRDHRRMEHIKGEKRLIKCALEEYRDDLLESKLDIEKGFLNVPNLSNINKQIDDVKKILKCDFLK